MTAYRTDAAGTVDRTRPLRLTFDGQTLHGFAGDTIASVLLANGVGIVSRSFKYHRPRGIWGAGVEEPNAIVDVAAPQPIRNCRATTEAAVDGMIVRSVSGTPTAASDRWAFIDRFARFLPSAFYYKTFMWPSWHVFEPQIRDMAGLSVLDPRLVPAGSAEHVHDSCDVLVIGGGPAGLFCALRAAEAGRSVVLCDEGLAFGGALLHRSAVIDGLPATDWVAQVLDRLARAGATLLVNTTAFGIYDHGLVALTERQADGRPDRLWKLRPQRIMLATGAIERPLPFASNDLPGIMSAEAGLAYLRRHGVVAGKEIVVASNNGHTREVVAALSGIGARVTAVDYRQGRQIVAASGKTGVTGVTLNDGTRIAADAVLVSGGFTPSLHLFCHARGKLRWDDSRLSFVAGDPVEGISIAGAAAGRCDLRGCLESAVDALNDAGIAPAEMPRLEVDPIDSAIVAAWPQPRSKGRIWIDLQHDVTAKDVELAARENFVSIEHLKRYTTLGMATDQGKTSNLNGLALMAQLTDRTIPQVGTTTYRPPFTPVPLRTLAGLRGGHLMNPVRRLVLEPQHRAAGANMREYGGWLRPAWYGPAPEDAAIQREARLARENVALFDGSPLGKVEVMGPQAADLINFIYYNAMASLKPGRCRYGFILNETGAIHDDGVLVRMAENHFIVSCSSSHVASVHALLEEWRQDRFDRRKVFIHNATAETATLTVTGPRSRDLLAAAGLGLALDDAALPHMAMGWGRFGGERVRATRVSFTGDRSYELSIRVDKAAALWAHLQQAGRAFDVSLLGVEALMLLRAEKGYVVIGKDTDSETTPVDLGFSAPLGSKRVDYLGRRSLFTEEAQRTDRRQLVGLEVIDGDAPLATGAHGVEITATGRRSIGYVTSSYRSPSLGRPIALGLIERGAARIRETIQIQHLGQIRPARLAAPCAFDPMGDRLNV